MQVLYKRRDGDLLIVAGHFNKREIKELQKEGYRMEQVNKHGIPVR